jgi:hypothetical protein
MQCRLFEVCQSPYTRYDEWQAILESLRGRGQAHGATPLRGDSECKRPTQEERKLFVRVSPPVTSPKTQVSRSWRRATFWVGATVVLAILAGAILFPRLTENSAREQVRAARPENAPSSAEAVAVLAGPPDGAHTGGFQSRPSPAPGIAGGAPSASLWRLAEEILALLEAGDLARAGALLRTVERGAAAALLADLAVRSESPGIGRAAVKLLASLDGPEAGRALVRLARDVNLALALRQEAALWLASCPEPEATGALLDLLASPDHAMRLVAVQALGGSKADSALWRLEAAAREDPDPAVRREALRALSRIGSPEAAAVLLSRLSADPPPAGLEREALLSAVAGLVSPEAVPGLLAELDTSTDSLVRRALVTSLARIADSRAFEALRAAAEGERDPVARIQAIQGLGRIGDPRALEVLDARSRSFDPAERAAAEEAIRQIQKRARPR